MEFLLTLKSSNNTIGYGKFSLNDAELSPKQQRETIFAIETAINNEQNIRAHAAELASMKDIPKYLVSDNLPDKTFKEFGKTHPEIKTMEWDDLHTWTMKRVRAIHTGHFRKVKAGEWYLSGAVPTAYYSKNGLSSKYHIMKLVVI